MKATDRVFDGLLVLEYRSGNKKSLSLLVKRHHLRLCRHAYGYTKDFEASKDIVQDAWSSIIHNMQSLKKPNSFGSWATMIVTRKSLDYLNKKNRDRIKLEDYSYDTETLEGPDETEPEIQHLLVAIKELPENQRMVLRLFYVEEYSLKEIADILEVSVGTIKSRLFHAREKLKMILKNNKK
ncbi:RNA polymerase sigma factor [Flagellimonas meishanensis]|uniref:RNA polymerase sigma factor n=1 Tax=Flagellimonas meishanensis TaxID=2873264 RepID=UPI001CA6AAFA|nr:RNA polymerase sigma factor [[Muricauda] meishanensis]